MTATTDPIDQALQLVVAGRCDDRLLDIAKALADRIRASLKQFSWRFRLDGVDVSELEITLIEWSEIQKLAEAKLMSLDPEQDVDHFLAIGQVLLRTRGGLDAAAARARVSTLTLDDISRAIEHEVREAPLDTPAPTGT